MIVKGIFWIFSVLVVLVLGVAGFVYYAMINGGLSSDYLTQLITEKITEEITHRSPEAQIQIGGVEFNLDISKLAIGTTARDVKITLSDTVYMDLKKITTTVDMQHLMNREIVIDNVQIADGHIVYEKNHAPISEKRQMGLTTVPSTQTDVDTHVKAGQQIANTVSAIGYTLSTKLRGLIDTSAQNIMVSYKDKGMWAKVRVDTAKFSNNKDMQKLTYTAGVDTQFFVEKPFNFGDVSGDISIQFTDKKAHAVINTNGISRDFTSGFDVHYSTDSQLVQGNFVNHTNDAELVSYIRSFVPFIKAQKSLAFNGQTDRYHLQNGGVVNLDYKADDYYGNAVISDVDNGWHINAKVHNLNDNLIQHYGDGFMQKTTLAWMHDNMHATYDVTLDLVFDKTAKKFVKAITKTELKNAKIIYQQGLPPMEIADAFVHMENKVTTFTADKGIIPYDNKTLDINNLTVVNNKGIINADLNFTGHMGIITALAFNKNTKINNPYAFAHITQGVFSGAIQTKFDSKRKKMLSYNITGTIPTLQAKYNTPIGTTTVNGNTTLNGVKIAVSPTATTLSIKTLNSTINDTTRGMNGPMALQDVNISVKSGITTVNIKSANGEVQGENIQFNGPVSADTLKISISPEHTLARIKSVQGNADEKPVHIQDIALDIKGNVLWFGGHVSGDVSKIIGDKLPNDMQVKQGNFKGTAKIKYYIKEKSLKSYNIQGTLNKGIVHMPVVFQGVKTPYVINTDTMAVNANNATTELRGDMAVNNTLSGNIHIIKQDTIMRLNFDGGLNTVLLSNLLPEQYIEIQKPVPVNISYDGVNMTDGTLKINANLQNINFEFPMLNWKKDTSAPANLVSSVVIKPNKNFLISVLANIEGGNPFYLKTQAVLDKDGLKTIDASDIKFKDERFNMAGIRKSGKMFWKINADTLTRKTVQVILDSHKNSKVTNKDSNLDVRFKLNTFIGYNGVKIAPVEGHFIREKDTIQLFEARMTLSEKTENNRLYAYYTPEKVRIITEDVGMFYGSIRKTNIFANGGWFAVVANADKNGLLQGKLQAKDIEITHTPDAVRILKLFSVVGVFDALESKNITFTKVTGKFTLNEGRLETENISGLGNIAISGKGYTDFKKKQLEINGMILPTYKVSSIIGQIPIIGQLLTGMDGGGFLSQNYTTKGTFDNYKVTINPMSIFTVGILRDIFAPIIGSENIPLEVN